MYNTLVAGNEAVTTSTSATTNNAVTTTSGTTNDVSGTIAAASSNNLIGGNATGITNGVQGNLVGVNKPFIGVLANNGGPTQTVALLAGSPAIDSSNSGCGTRVCNIAHTRRGGIRIDDIAKTGQANAFQQMIETAVASTGKFRVIERRVGGLLAEQQGAKAGLYTTNQPGKIGGFEGADFLIEASITTGEAAQRSNIGASLGRSFLSHMLTNSNTTESCSNTVASLGVDVKIIDASTGW